MKLLISSIAGAILSFSITSHASPVQPSQTITAETEQKTLTSEPIIAYFSKEATQQDCDCMSHYSVKPAENGYYRKLLGRGENGDYLIQDFYFKSQKPANDPFWVNNVDG